MAAEAEGPLAAPPEAAAAAPAAAGEADADEATEIEVTLFHARDCVYVYKIPPRMSTLSYRADEWDVNKWVWEGACRVVSRGDFCEIRLEDAASGELFAAGPVRESGPQVIEPVIDSSRYFVLRVESEQAGRTRHAFIGIGFRERTTAYDFQAALHDHLQYLTRKREAAELAQRFDAMGGPKLDLKLKEGQKITININKAAAKLWTGGFLPPPPPPPSEADTVAGWADYNAVWGASGPHRAGGEAAGSGRGEAEAAGGAAAAAAEARKAEAGPLATATTSVEAAAGRRGPAAAAGGPSDGTGEDRSRGDADDDEDDDDDDGFGAFVAAGSGAG